MTGYTAAQLDDIQGKWNLRFPPDLLEVYRRRRRVIDNELGFDWLKTPTDNIRKQLQWPLTGMLFDIEKNDFWLPEWGERPSDASDRHDIARSAIAAAPKLIPIHGHRCISETPHKAGNPIFSVCRRISFITVQTSTTTSLGKTAISPPNGHHVARFHSGVGLCD